MLFLYKNARNVRLVLFTKTSNRTEDTHEYMTLRRRYPQPGSSNHQHPHHPQPTPSGVLSIGDHGTTDRYELSAALRHKDSKQRVT